MSKRIVIITYSVFNPANNSFYIGGHQSYVKFLAKLFNENSYKVDIYQLSNETWERSVNGIDIYGIKAPSAQKMFDKISKDLPSNVPIIVSTDQLNVRTKKPNAIVINHGILFDQPVEKTGFRALLKIFEKWFRCIRNVIRYSYIPNTVCVDYNYYNWLITVTSVGLKDKIRVIPNFAQNSISETELKEKISKSYPLKSIVFARRFVKNRGVLVFANIAEKLLSKYPDITITFAGGGPYKEFLENKFANNSRVSITSYECSKSLEFHTQFDIAVVPTIYSEGTSLSLLDAMSAGCFPIATYIGGLTNILVDNYNGYLAYPDEENIYNSIEKALALSAKEYENIIVRAWNTARVGFSFEGWSKKWLEVVESVSK